METLRLLKDLEELVLAQKTVLGVTYNFHQEDFRALTNKIRAMMAVPSSPEMILDKTATVLTRHLRSQEEVATVISEIRLAIGTMS